MNLILHSATTSSKICCSQPMQISGLGDKFGVEIIINLIKTPNKEPAFSPLMEISTNLGYVGSFK